MFLKLLGLLLILTASSLAGIYKSLKLRERTAKLNRIYRSLTELRERVRLSSGEIVISKVIVFSNSDRLAITEALGEAAQNFEVEVVNE